MRLLLGGGGFITVMAALWQLGILFSEDDTTGVDDGVVAALRPADTSVDTPGSSSRPVGLTPGQLAPNFAFSGYHGERLQLSDFRGAPLVLNFWASWCGPCKAEMPRFEEALGRFQPQRLAVVAINSGESYATGRRFIDEIGVRLSAVGYDPQQDISRRYGVSGLPVTYFIDADGIITRVTTGAVSDGLLQSGIEDAIGGWGAAETLRRQ